MALKEYRFGGLVVLPNLGCIDVSACLTFMTSRCSAPLAPHPPFNARLQQLALVSANVSRVDFVGSVQVGSEASQAPFTTFSDPARPGRGPTTTNNDTTAINVPRPIRITPVRRAADTALVN